MCLSVPAKVLSVQGDRATVESRGWQRDVDVSQVAAKRGDFVLVQGGVAMMALSAAEAEDILAAWDEVEDPTHA